MRLSFIVSVMCVASIAPAVNAAQENTKASSPAAMSSQPDKRQSSDLALRLLGQVEQAKQSLAANQTQAADEHIDRALADRDRLSSMARTNVRPVIVPLYWEFDDTAVLGRAMAARKVVSNRPASRPR
jgi:hypothetical protein